MESELRRSILLGMAAILAGCGGSGSDNPDPPSDSSIKKAKMTVLLYINGSDLESGKNMDGSYKHEGNSATENIQELLQASYNPEVNVILQTGGTLKQGWETIKRKQVKNQTLIELSPAENPNASFADPQTLVDFVQWTGNKFPAEKYILIFWNHGGGPIDGFGADQINLYNGENKLNTKNIQIALEKSIKAIGQKFELIGFDACLMASYEIASAIKNTANYYIASEELEPGGGWDYTSTFNYISTRNSKDGKEIGRKIVNSYMNKHKFDPTITLSLLDFSKFDRLQKSLSELFNALNTSLSTNGLSTWLKIAKSRSQSLDFVSNIFMGTRSLDLMDLGSFLNSPKIKETGLAQSIIDDSINALNEVVLLRRWNSLMEQTSGLTLWFPSFSITNESNFLDYTNNIPEIDGISNFIKNYTLFANSSNIPKIAVSDPIKSGINSISSTISSDYYEQAYAVLLDSNNSIVSIQDIKGESNQITLTHSNIWPTIDGKPVSLAANYNVSEDPDSFIMLALIDNQRSDPTPVFLIFDENYICNSYYEYAGQFSTHNNAPRTHKLPPSVDIIIPQLKLQDTSIEVSDDSSFTTNTGINAEISIQRKSIDISQLKLYLGTSDLIGRMSFSIQPAVL